MKRPEQLTQTELKIAGALSRLFARLSCCAALACLLLSAPLRAQDVDRTALGPGKGQDALPGVYEVPLGVQAESGVAARVGGSYGWTEEVLKMGDTHQRLQLDAAASITPLPWLSASLRLLGRYDTHSSAGTSDDGITTQTYVGARTTFRLSSDFQAGSELTLWLPAGDSVGKAFAALSGDLRLLLAYAPESSPLTIGLTLGLRLDRSRYGGGEPDRYSASDRLALGVSDSLWAVLPGVAFSYRTGPVEWLAEWAFRMYFDYVAESPMWIRAGARYRPTTSLQLELLLGASPSKRPSFADGAPLQVVEPRLWAGLSMTYTWLAAEPQPTAAEPEPAPVAPEPEPRATLQGQVLAAGGATLPGASLTLTGADTSADATSDEGGKFSFAELAPGEYQLLVRAEGFQQEQRSLDVQPGAAPLSITLTRELPIGQIRGTVRRFDGQPIVARVAIAELGIENKTRADGTFEIDVPPGDYSVVVTADRFKKQSRTAHVEQRGVAILIVELEPRK